MLRLVCAALVWAALAAGVWADGRVISVDGTGEVAMAPDMAVLRVGAQAEAPEAEAALAAASDSLRKVLAQFAEQGVSERDVQTGTLNLTPVYDRRDNGTRSVRGYVARSTLNVRVRDLTKLGGLLDAVVGSGATEFGGLQFTLSDPSKAEAEARAAAVRDAAAKARQIADAAEVTLGAVQQISEGGPSFSPVVMEMARASAMADVPIAEGEVSVRVQVSAVYAID